MVNVTEYYSKSGLVSAEDLPEPKTVTMGNVEERNLAQEGEEGQPKLVLTFNDFDKDIALNKTNAEKIAELVGSSNTDDWPGKKITLFRDTVTTEGKFKGKPCVRVREAAASASHNYEDQFFRPGDKYDT